MILEKTPGGTYQVVAGDSLSKIASSHGRSLADLLAINPQFASNPNLIRPGQTVNLSAPSSGFNLPSSRPGDPTANNTQPSANPSFTSVLTQILKNYQTGNANQYTGNNTALLRGKENIEKTNADIYSQDFKNANLSNEARLSLLKGDEGLQSPGLKSITSQQDANQARYESTNDLIKSTQTAYEKEQERIARAKEVLADAEYKSQVLAETIRSNKANERIAGIKATESGSGGGGVFGSAKLTTGQKNDVADMLVLQKQIDALKGLKEKHGGYVGAAGGGLGSLQSAFQKITGAGYEGGQDTRNAIGQIKGFIAKLRGGTSFTPNEQKLLDSYTPGINDSDPVIDSKLNSLQNYIRDKIESTVLVAGGTYIPETPVASSGVLRSPDGKLEVNTSELTPTELQEAREAGWR